MIGWKASRCLMTIKIKLLIFVILIIFEINFLFAQMHFRENRELTNIEKNSLFDIFVEIPSQYQKIEVNEDILFSLKLVNLGSEGRIDVLLDYGIVDEKEKCILCKTETVAVETQATFVRQLDLSGIPIGEYKIKGKITYADGKVAETTNSFRIVKKQKEILIELARGLIIFILVIIIIYKSRNVLNRLLIKLKIKQIVKSKKNKNYF